MSMYLKEFELDLPYASDKEKIIKIMEERGIALVGKAKDIPMEWKWVRREFVLETRCISAMFDRLFGKFKTDGCRKIIVECVDIVKNENVRNLLGVHVVQVKYNFLDFISLSDFEKKCTSLLLLKEGIEKVAAINGWDFTPFESVFTKIIEKNYINEWMWSKPVKSPNRQYNAEIFCQHEVRSMNIYIVIKNKKSEVLGKSLLISDQPHEFAYSKHLGEVEWLSEEVVTLANKQYDEKWELDIRQFSNNKGKAE
jgi:hypothetical protein